jgi:regulator of sirC expression with transglutaminase-like and TPR domain
MDLDAALRTLADDSTAPLDIARVALLLAADEYPQLDIDQYLARIDHLATAVASRLTGTLSERAAALGSFLFDDEGFRGNAEDYYAPENSYINVVLDRRLGIPISLSVLAMAVGTRAGLNVVGVGLPGHFVAKAVDGDREALFDPFHGGRLLTPSACEKLVAQVTGSPFRADDEALLATPTLGIVQRMLTNLKGVYAQRQDFRRAARVTARLYQLSPHDPTQRRDLGILMVQTGKAGPAIDHLQAYLEVLPAAPDRPAVEKFLAAAKREVARWN